MRTICLASLTLLCAACSTTGNGTRSDADAPKKAPREKPRKRTARASAKGGPTELLDEKPVPKPTEDELREFHRIWELYRTQDPRWPLERDRFRARSDAAGYVLAGHLLQHYMRVNAQRDRAGRQLVAVKNEIVAVGAPCVPFLLNLMVLDHIETRDGPPFYTDDLTRQDCIDMIERIGSPAVPDLLDAIERDLPVKGRRLVVLALGGTRDPRAFDALVERLRKDPEWQVRADAATALGKLGDQRAVGPLTETIRGDADPAVVKRAGKVRYHLLSGKAPR